MDTKTFDWVCGQLTKLGYIVLRDELVNRWKAHPEVIQDEQAEREEWERCACGRKIERLCSHCSDHREWERAIGLK